MINLNSVVLAAEEFTEGDLIVVSLDDFPTQILLFLLSEALKGVGSSKQVWLCSALTVPCVPLPTIGKAAVPSVHLALVLRLLVSTVSLWGKSDS